MDLESQSQPHSQSGMELEPPSLKKSDRPRHKRRRRRSSARFLRLTGRLMEDIDEVEEEEEESVEPEQNLGDMYKRAIRMNAENRINATNSWNLRLIENIDKFLEDDENGSSPRRGTASNDENQDPNYAVGGEETSKQGNGANKEKRVNFTKASCTLDASVKIYSYRVDDVHLTSYKVLANLNRTESNDGNSQKKNKKDKQGQAEGGAEADGGAMIDDDDDDNEEPSEAPYKSADTLESNVANINMNKLDSTFDIDPLFHKMSKTFDEGGAKGLLLVNLGVGDKGCNIVFDSKAECEAEETQENGVRGESRSEGMVDISSLLSKLETMEATQSSIDSMPLVPQLESLRDQYAQLNEEGFVEKRKKAPRRYASTMEEEREADKSIHEEAIERSRASIGVLGHPSFVSMQEENLGNNNVDEEDPPMFAADDFGGGDDDDDDDDDFENFLALDDNGGRFSAISFRDSFAPEPSNKSQVDVLLDAICSGNVLGGSGGGEYEFFDSKALEMSMADNQWAGSQHMSFPHWKRSEPRRKCQELDNQKTSVTNKSNRAKKPKKKSAPWVDLTDRPVLEDILRKPPKGKRGINPLQMSRAMIASKTKEDHLLPYDTGAGVDNLASLFLRRAMVQPAKEKPSPKNKTVCFDTDIETFGGGGGYNDGIDDSFGGGDEDGEGFVFASDDNDDDTEDNHQGQDQDDFVIEELKGVRKVDTKSVRVGYATIAKKVDVRRLKRDLWSGIESSMGTRSDVPEEEEKEDGKGSDNGLSFQDTVRDMEETKTQVDVTLPFYFICVLHLANEKGLKLESLGLEDFIIRGDTSCPTPSV